MFKTSVFFIEKTIKKKNNNYNFNFKKNSSVGK